MESQPKNPEFKYNPKNFHPCVYQACLVCLIVVLHPSQQLWSHRDRQLT